MWVLGEQQGGTGGGKASNQERKRVESRHLHREQKEMGSAGKTLRCKAREMARRSSEANEG